MSDTSARGSRTPSRRRIAWKAALVLGLISGTFSTLIITLGAPRIGRTRAVDWMTIGTVALGADAISDDPGWRQLLSGVLVHQAADLAWALVLFALGRYWTYSLGAGAITLIAAPWAVATSAVEYYVLLPRLQPLVPLEVPYWTALSVHATSAVAYPLFPWIRSRVAGSTPSSGTAAASRTAILMVCLLVVLVLAEALAQSGHEPKWPLEDRIQAAFDQQFMAAMAGHHAAGVELAEAALTGPLSTEAAALARLIIAEQRSEIDLLRGWWHSWVGGEMPSVRQGLTGIPPPATVTALAQSTSPEREPEFLRLMIDHHGGALLMTQGARDRAADPRIWLFAASVSHAQLGQIMWMRAMLGEPAPGHRPPRFR